MSSPVGSLAPDISSTPPCRAPGSAGTDAVAAAPRTRPSPSCSHLLAYQRRLMSSEGLDQLCAVACESGEARQRASRSLLQLGGRSSLWRRGCRRWSCLRQVAAVQQAGLVQGIQCTCQRTRSAQFLPSRYLPLRHCAVHTHAEHISTHLRAVSCGSHPPSPLHMHPLQARL